MKKFKRHITGKELVSKCARNLFPYDSMRWRNQGGDFITFGFHHEGVFVDVIYNVVNGRAFGSYGKAEDDQMSFSTDDKLDGTPWFDALLSFIYVS